MDYEKLHKETLAALQQRVSEGKITEEIARSICADFVKEFDDERIRKECISIIDAWDKACRLQGDYCEVAPECIAWLEKQEQLNKVSLWKHWKDGIAGNEEGKLIYLIKNGNDYSLSSCLGFECDYIELSELDKLMLSEKQGEQKPTDKVKQDDVELTDFESALFSAFSDAWQEYLSGKEVNVAKWAREHSAELLEVAIEQKPAWSEEDEITYRVFIQSLARIAANTRTDSTSLNYTFSREIAWLKSLKERYIWKPSDEQLHYLSWIANIKLGNSVVEQEISKHLNELLEDLKKLKE